MKMNKSLLRLLAGAAVLLGAYHVVVFLIPFLRTPMFWTCYGFTLAAVAVMVAALYIGFVRKPDAKSRFFGFPIARIGVLYGAVQLVLGLVGMSVAKWFLAWPAVILFSLVLSVALISLITAGSVTEEIARQDDRLQDSQLFMRGLQARVSRLVLRCEEESAAQAVKVFAEELRFSDPVSAPALAEAEAELAAAVDALEAAVAENADTVRALCRKAQQMLDERNRLCKLSK
jgi:membrane glycosyltransferase